MRREPGNEVALRLPLIAALRLGKHRISGNIAAKK
jgi:hypothetical protein